MLTYKVLKLSFVVCIGLTIYYHMYNVKFDPSSLIFLWFMTGYTVSHITICSYLCVFSVVLYYK